MGPSSLQNAVSVSLVKTDKGQFENCFASGLDLSEFDSKSRETNASTKTSASKALLIVKATEKQHIQQQEEDDERLEDMVKRRVENLTSSTSAHGVDKVVEGVARAARPDMSYDSTIKLQAGGMVEALFGMHSMDKQDERFKISKNKRMAKKAQRSKHQLPQKGRRR